MTLVNVKRAQGLVHFLVCRNPRQEGIRDRSAWNLCKPQYPHYHYHHLHYDHAEDIDENEIATVIVCLKSSQSHNMLVIRINIIMMLKKRCVFENGTKHNMLVSMDGDAPDIHNVKVSQLSTFVVFGRFNTVSGVLSCCRAGRGQNARDRGTKNHFEGCQACKWNSWRHRGGKKGEGRGENLTKMFPMQLVMPAMVKMFSNSFNLKVLLFNLLWSRIYLVANGKQAPEIRKLKICTASCQTSNLANFPNERFKTSVESEAHNFFCR